mmetsp:Transcript_87948/g.155950  ORF Transcript_87948/g.155950 Transcript_87948/m.155950 type:complete len:308 (-) Transcript_87948:159-1082(-)
MMTPTNEAGLYVKNTFLDFMDEDRNMCGSTRRSSSLPPSLKLQEKAEEECDQGEDSDLTPTTACVDRVGSCAEICSEADSTEASSGGSTDDTSDVAHPVPEVLVPRPRTKLKASSACYTPCQQRQPTSFPVCEVQDSASKEVYACLGQLAEMLLGNGDISNSKITTTEGFNLTVNLNNPVQVQSMERMLTSAKTWLLSWAERTSNIYILGYCGKPFLPVRSGPGFIATLSPLPDSDYSSTCWQAFKWGSCSRALNCRWKHPKQMIPMTLRVEIELPTVTYFDQGYAMNTDPALNYAQPYAWTGIPAM